MINYSLKEDEYFYGGAINDGVLMPFDKNTTYEINLTDWHGGNQAASLLFSNLGHIFYSKEAFKFSFYRGELYIFDDEVEKYHIHGSFQEIHKWIRKNIFQRAKETPNELMFQNPIFNTWIEMGKDVSQEKILKYANDIIDHGYKPGVLMIDDGWCKDYGNYDFDKKKFPKPKLMIKTLHALGFKVVLWLTPFINFECEAYKKLSKNDLLVQTHDGLDFPAKWWNGTSAVLDLTNPKACECLVRLEKSLMKKYDVDGFKLDAGDPEWYRGTNKFFLGKYPANQAENFANLGYNTRFDELRVGFNNGVSPVLNRMRDKYHSWDKEGINTLIPNAIVMGLLGYPYLCPDMIGGGVLDDFNSENFQFDEELYVRYAQLAAFMPTMQFSLAPWKCLKNENQAIVKTAIKYHEKFADLFIRLAIKAKDGEPIIRSMYYVEDDIDYINIKDQFFIGNDILVCPQITKEPTRIVYLPKGKWISEFGELFKGGKYKIETPLNRIPYFKRIK